MASVRLSNWTSEAKYLALAGSYLMATVSVLKIVLSKERTSFRSTLSHGGLEERGKRGRTFKDGGTFLVKLQGLQDELKHRSLDTERRTLSSLHLYTRLCPSVRRCFFFLSNLFIHPSIHLDASLFCSNLLIRWRRGPFVFSPRRRC